DIYSLRIVFRVIPLAQGRVAARPGVPVVDPRLLATPQHSVDLHGDLHSRRPRHPQHPAEHLPQGRHAQQGLFPPRPGPPPGSRTTRPAAPASCGGANPPTNAPRSGPDPPRRCPPGTPAPPTAAPSAPSPTPPAVPRPRRC